MWSFVDKKSELYFPMKTAYADLSMLPNSFPRE